MKRIPPGPVERPQKPAPGFVQWDETPSLADSMSWRLQRSGGIGTVPNFPDTVPANLMPTATPATPFREPVDGLSVREISDDDLFIHLFGKSDSSLG